jgi:hypothetical protein
MRRALLFAFVLTACSKGAESDVEYIKQARSAAAEWALVNDQARQGRLTRTYVSSMHRWVREEIESSVTSLSEPDSKYGDEIAALLQQPDDASPQELRARSARLKRIEDSLESR